MKNWSLRPDPGAHDPARYVLWIKGEMRQLTRIIKKFGAMCGRPVRVKHPEGFNFRIYLHEMTPRRFEEVSRHLEEVVPGSDVDLAVSQPASIPVLAVVEPKPPETPVAEAPIVETPVADTPVEPPPAAVSTLTSAKPLWGLEASFNPKQNFENFLVGPCNRFAHAAATSVVGSPGTMYNPLFIHGVPGCGKTHILHALAGALGQGSCLLTTGPALAWAATQACATGRFGEIESRVANAKALLVDDVHLTDIKEKNNQALAKIFKSFLERKLQVIVTSLYAPRSLAALEDALKISFSQGWVVDMKLPASGVQMDVMASVAQRRGMSLGRDEIAKLHGSGGFHYWDFPKLLARWKVLHELGHARGCVLTSDEIVSQLMNSGERLSADEVPLREELDEARQFVVPNPGPDALPLACFFPKGQEAMADWILARFHELKVGLGIRRSYREVLREAYDANQPFGLAFQIGESCQRSGACAALVLGPGKDSKLIAQAEAFSHAVEHLLRDFGVATGWIPVAEIVVTRPFLAAHLDFIAFQP